LGEQLKEEGGKCAGHFSKWKGGHFDDGDATCYRFWDWPYKFWGAGSGNYKSAGAVPILIYCHP
jgi:hypothetical protein